VIRSLSNFLILTIYKESVSTITNLLWNENIPWMLKVIRGSVVANKEHLFAIMNR